MGFSLASIITASFGNGPRGRELARAEAAKNDSPTIPEASAAVPAAPNCRKFLREAPLPLHRELLSMFSPPAVLQDLGLAKTAIPQNFHPAKCSPQVKMLPASAVHSPEASYPKWPC